MWIRKMQYVDYENVLSELYEFTYRILRMFIYKKSNGRLGLVNRSINAC